MPPIENATSYKTTGGNNQPGYATVSPAAAGNFANDDSAGHAPFAIGGQNVSGYVNVDPIYRNYASSTQEPLPVSPTGVPGHFELGNPEDEQVSAHDELPDPMDDTDEPDDEPKKPAAHKAAAHKATAPKA